MEELRKEMEKLRLEVEEERRRHAKELSRFSVRLAELAAQAESDSEPETVTPKEKTKTKAKKVESSEEDEKPAKKEPVKEEKPVKKVEPGSVDDTSFNEFEREALKAHNEYRAKHGVPPLRLTRELCNFAQEWANHLSNICCLQHRTPHSGKGENLWGGPCSGIQVDGRTAVKAWYDEVSMYNYGCGGFSMQTGHFTQVVWRETKELGIAISRNNRGHIYIAANYLPTGNMMGAFQQNVPPPVR